MRYVKDRGTYLLNCSLPLGVGNRGGNYLPCEAPCTLEAALPAIPNMVGTVAGMR